MSDDLTQTRPMKRRRSRLPLVLLAISVTGLIALAAIGAAYVYGRDVAPVGSAASSSPTASPVDEKGMCVLFVPVAQQAADLIVEFSQHPDGTKTDWAQMEQVAANLKTIRDIAPAERRAEIQTHVDALQMLLDVHRTGANRVLDFEAMRAAGLSLAVRCSAHAD